MITIVCGQDIVSSRKYFKDVIDSYAEKGYATRFFPSSTIEEVLKADTGESQLFEDKSVFYTENLTRAISRRKDPEFLKKLKAAAALPDKIILDWEEGKAAYEIRFKEAVFKEFKPATSVFKLIDACYPGNFGNFYRLFQEVADSQDAEFVFTMLSRNMRQLLQAKAASLPASVPAWQRGKLASQAKFWSWDQLLGFYEGLYRIDLSNKTSSSTYSTKNALDILSVFYLR